MNDFDIAIIAFFLADYCMAISSNNANLLIAAAENVKPWYFANKKHLSTSMQQLHLTTLRPSMVLKKKKKKKKNNSALYLHIYRGFLRKLYQQWWALHNTFLLPTCYVWMLGQDPLASLFNTLGTPTASFFSVCRVLNYFSICWMNFWMKTWNNLECSWFFLINL